MSSSKKILIIDDDPQVHKLLTAVLVPKNFVVLSALEAEEGWKLAQKEKPDLIILDIMMPEMSGIEICQKIRQEENLKETLVLMLSAKDTQSDRLKGLQYGADDYVNKPFHMTTLVHKIEHMLGKL